METFARGVTSMQARDGVRLDWVGEQMGILREGMHVEERHHSSFNQLNSLIRTAPLYQLISTHFVYIRITANMQFLTAATLFAAALAAPAPQTTDCPNPAHCGSAPDPSTYDNIDITDFTLRKNDGIQGASFTLSGSNGTAPCSIGAVPSLPSAVEKCGDSLYRFGLIEATSQGAEVGLRLYREFGPGVGFTGEGDVPTYCHAGGNGIDDQVCQQVTALTIVIN